MKVSPELLSVDKKLIVRIIIWLSEGSVIMIGTILNDRYEILEDRRR